jgi:site-specific recombinase XerD
MSLFDKHIDSYLDDLVRLFNHQPSGAKAIGRDLALFSSYARDQSISNVSGDGLLRFLAYLCEQRSNGAGSINRKISSIRGYIGYLRFHQVEGADTLPIECLRRARTPYSGPVHALEPQEVARILYTFDRQSVIGFRDFLLFSLLYRLGLRLGEALALDLHDIDFDKEVIHIHGKGRRQRTLPLVSDLGSLIRNWLILRQRLYRADREQALFLSKKGNRLAPRTAQESFQKTVALVRPLSLDKVTPHSLRHAFASHAIEGDADLVVLKAVLGHAVMKSTEIYLHPSMKLLQRAVNAHPAAEILDDLIEEDIIALRVHQQRVATAAA